MGANPRKFNPSKLLVYARDNDAAAIEYAVVHLGADVAFSNKNGQTALHIAAGQGSLDAIRKLVALELSPNVEDVMSQTPLHLAAAAHKNVFEACSALLQLGADPFAADLHGRLAYEIAKDDELKSLLGAPEPQLYSAAAEGDLVTLRRLFHQRPEQQPCPIGSDGFSPFHLAVRGDHLDVAQFLLERGALVNQRELSMGDTAVHLAVRGGHVGMLSLLSRHGANLNKQNFHMSKYIDHGAEIRGDPLHQAPLHVAIDEYNAEMVRILLELGAAADPIDFDGLSPLHYAIEFEDSRTAAMLLRGGADPNRGCDDFASPLHLAAQQGDVNSIRVLLHYGGAVDSADEEGWTPLMLAVRGGELAAAKMLLEAGARVDAASIDGDTSLHLAAASGSVKMSELVVDAAAKIHGALLLTNNEGKTAAEVAKSDYLRLIF